MLLRRSREFAGRFVGDVMAPALWTGTRLRQARVFHPVGTVLAATVVPIAEAGVEGALAQRLGGFAVLRFSGGAAERLAALGAGRAELSISDERQYALAFVVLVRA